MRNNTVRIDEDAFNRGVDEILQLKPIRRVFGQIVHTCSQEKVVPSKNTTRSKGIVAREKSE